MKIYIFEIANCKIENVYTCFDHTELEEIKTYIELDGNTSISISDEMVHTIIDNCRDHFSHLECVYEDAIVDYIGIVKFNILRALQEIVFIAKIDNRRLYAF